ncbi:YgaP family membrane protein [Aquimarina sp. M1]
MNLFYHNYIGETLGIVLLSISEVMVITGFMGWCPLYLLLGAENLLSKE